MLRQIKRIMTILIILCYVIAVAFKSDLLGNILSPIATLLTFDIVLRAYYISTKPNKGRITGLLLALSILAWAITDIIWGVMVLVFHIDPEKMDIITYGYSITNIFLTVALSIYGINVFRKWNSVQVLLDSIVITFSVITLTWIIFLGEDVKNIMKIQSDWVSVVSVVLDIMIVIWITISFLSIRNGKTRLSIRVLAFGSLLFAITDLVYYYQYLYGTYDPNTMLDAIYIISFGIISISGVLHRKEQEDNIVGEVYNNIGRKSNAILLLLAPLLVIIFKGIIIEYLLLFITVIMLYLFISYNIQKNIYKDGLLQQELVLNIELEKKVNARTEELILKNHELETLLNKDYNTGLYNRRYLMKHLEDEVDTLSEEETILLLYLDINRFKMMVTMFGHYIADRILAEMARRLSILQATHEGSILASYGEDAFVFSLKGKFDYPEGYVVAQEAINLASDIYRIDEYRIRITANIGISIFPYDATTKEELIKHADIAMSQARVQGFNIVRVFDLKLSEAFFQRNLIELMLKRVSFEQEFMIYYQPQLLTNSKELIGFEALLRWKTQSGEFIPPCEFIPVAEETGYIVPIGDWVIKTAMKQITAWNKNSNIKIMIGINVSIKQLNTLTFIDHLIEVMEELDLDPSWIDLEITESLDFQENSDLMCILEEVRTLGVSISIDDFGTGFSSLSYLKNLPIDRIKIAKELVDFVHTDDFDYQLVKSIISLARAKGIKVIAEGVEKDEQWAVLMELECDEVQGYLFGRPMPLNVVEATYAKELNL